MISNKNERGDAYDCGAREKPVPDNRKGRAFQVLRSAPQGGEQETERQVI